MILADGSTLIVATDSFGSAAQCIWSVRGTPSCCGAAVIDVNGLKPPNRVGRDIFYFTFMANNRILPIGAKGYGMDDYPSYCNPGYGISYGTDSGIACAGRAILEGGIKY